jgi:hypothetical protein
MLGSQKIIYPMIGATYTFSTELDLQMVGTYRYHAIKIPVETQNQIEFIKGVKHRFEGEINGRPFSGALMPTGTGRYYAMVNESIRKELDLQLGDSVLVTMTIIDPNLVSVPDDLQVLLDQDQNVKFKWDVLSAGTKRGILHQITSARTQATRTHRLDNLLIRLKNSQPFESFSMRDRL